MATNEADIVAERQQLVLDRLDQGCMIAARNIAASDRAVEQDIADMGKAHLLVEVHDAAWRVTGTMQDLEGQFADRDGITFLQPAIRREIAHAAHAETRPARHAI